MLSCGRVVGDAAFQALDGVHRSFFYGNRMERSLSFYLEFQRAPRRMLGLVLALPPHHEWSLENRRRPGLPLSGSEVGQLYDTGASREAVEAAVVRSDLISTVLNLEIPFFGRSHLSFFLSSYS